MKKYVINYETIYNNSSMYSTQIEEREKPPVIGETNNTINGKSKVVSYIEVNEDEM